MRAIARSTWILALAMFEVIVQFLWENFPFSHENCGIISLLCLHISMSLILTPLSAMIFSPSFNLYNKPQFSVMNPSDAAPP